MKKIYTIGRDEGCDIVIPDSTDVISRLHATIRIESNNKIYLIDQSRNGTYVNGMKMSSNVEIPVSRNDVVSFAHIYNLDWNLVPKHKGGALQIALIAFAGIAVVAGVAFAVISGMNKEEVLVEPVPTPVENVEQAETPAPVEATKPEATEDTSKPDTAAEEKKATEEKAKKKKKDDATKEQPKEEEEIYNPIY